MNRRHLLAGLAAGSATITIATGAALALDPAEGGTVMVPPSDADAALIALGRDLDEAVAAFLAFEPAYEKASAASAAAIEANRYRFDAVRGRGDEAFLVVWREVAGDHDAAIRQGNDLMEAADALVAQIMDTRPATLAGAAVQARAVAFTVDPTPGPVEANRDWDKLVVLRLAANLAALAG